MTGIIEEIRAFRVQKSGRETEARQLAALQLACGIDLSDALMAEQSRGCDIIRRIERMLERERLKGLRRHWSYDLNRHIAMKQALEQLRRVHVPHRPDSMNPDLRNPDLGVKAARRKPMRQKTRRRPKAPPG